MDLYDFYLYKVFEDEDGYKDCKFVCHLVGLREEGQALLKSMNQMRPNCFTTFTMTEDKID